MCLDNKKKIIKEKKEELKNKYSDLNAYSSSYKINENDYLNLKISIDPKIIEKL